MNNNIFLLSENIPANPKLYFALKRELGDRVPKMAYISSVPQDSKRAFFYSTMSDYQGMLPSLKLEYFDLSSSFDDASLKRILGFDIIYLSGGNSYVFLDGLRRRNVTPLIRQRLQEGALVIGASAGAIVMTPNIDTSIFCGDERIPEVADFTGMRFVDFCFLPHLGSHFFATTESMKQVRGFSKKVNKPVYVCSDADGVFIRQGKIQLFGNIKKVNWRD